MVICGLLAVAALLWPVPPSRSVRSPVRGGLARRRVGAPRDRRRTIPVLLGPGAAGMAVVVLMVAGPAGLVATCAVLATGGRLVHQALQDRRRRKAFIDLLAGLRTLGRELRAGAEPAVAAANAAAVAHGDGAVVLSELAHLTRSDARHRVGAPPSSGGPAVDDDDPRHQVLARLHSGWLLTRRHGVAFTPLIEALAADVAEQLAADERRAGEVAGPRVSGYVMALLPALGLALGIGMGADPVQVLVGSPIGAVLLLVGVSLSCIGLLWSARIVRR